MILSKEKVPVAIDLLSVILPTDVYLKLIEKFDPRVPLVNTLESVLKGVTVTEVKQINAKLDAVFENAKALQEISIKLI